MTDKNPARRLAWGMLAAAAFLLSACGKGTSGGGSPGTLADIQGMVVTGGSFQMKMDTPVAFAFLSGTMQVTPHVRTHFTYDPETGLAKNCDMEPAQALDPNQLIDPDRASSANSSSAFLSCPGTNAEVERTGEGSYRMNLLCDDGTRWPVEFVRLSAMPRFDQGTFRLRSADFIELNASDRVCADVMDFRSVLSGIQEIPGLSESETQTARRTIVAPYQGGWVQMDLLFSKVPLTAGSYEVVDVDGPTGLTSVGPGQVGVRLQGRDLDEIAFDAGTVTLTESNDRRFAGTFELSDRGSAGFNGAFDLHL